MSDIKLPDVMGALFVSARFKAYREGSRCVVYRTWNTTATDKKGIRTVTPHIEKFNLSDWNPKNKSEQNVKAKIAEMLADLNGLCNPVIK
jgi:hypothetical protein